MSKWKLPPNGGHMDNATGIYYQNMTEYEIKEKLKKKSMML